MAIKVDDTGRENTLFRRRVRAPFSPEISQAAAVKGLRNVGLARGRGQFRGTKKKVRKNRYTVHTACNAVTW